MISTNKQKILIVDDKTKNLDVLLGLLKDEYKLFAAPEGPVALQIARKQKPDLILLDIMMPGMDGYEVCKQLKADESTKEIPVIFITAKVETDNELKGFEVGGVDYITKPFSPPAVLARVKAHLSLKREKDLREHVERISRHDLKTPLNTVINFPKIIIQDNLTEKQIEQLNKISAAGIKLLNMINLSFDLYKMEQGSYVFKPMTIDILPIIDQVCQDHRSYIKSKRATIEITVNDKPVTEGMSFKIPGEELLFYSMLANLFKNALEASPRMGTIKISLTDTNKFNIAIHNQGAVPKKIRKIFFEKYATSGKIGGTGLGTYSAKLITETQGGSIRMESSEEAGTIVELSF
ncbi:response regulator receiver sensor signal transduction histidine kinase [Candidatus Magnetomorum sp. HK-1]|nr:response regulator receiver sensor signal transduction histidine kinase [Candidatus Magnetomorum sp. HK-1]